MFPAFPSSLALTGNAVTWDSWTNPGTFAHIEFSVEEIGGDETSLYANLSAAQTSYILPADFLQIGGQYEIQLWFVSSDFASSHKASISIFTIDLNSICDIQMSQQTYIDGDTITANIFRLANPTSATIALEIKVWLNLPGFPPISLFNLGSDGSFALPAGTDINLGPIPLLSIIPGLPRGTYGLNCRMLNPITGQLLAEDSNVFDVQ